MKRGQIDISFGMVFSIIIIIATVAVGGYVIFKFVDFGTTTDCGFMYREINDAVEKAYSANLAQEIIQFDAPNKVEQICFGNLSAVTSATYKEQYEVLRRYDGAEANLFAYPLTKSCADLQYYNIRHAKIDGFFCIPIQSGTLKIKITKGSFEPLPKITAP